MYHNQFIKIIWSLILIKNPENIFKKKSLIYSPNLKVKLEKIG